MRLLPLLPALLLVAGCGRQIERVAEGRLNDRLRALIGPADRYATRVRGGESLLRGRARSIHVDGWNVRVTEDLTLDAVAFDLTDVEADRNTGQIRRLKSVAFAAELGEANLARYVASRRLGIPELRLRVGERDLTVSGRPEVLGFSPARVAISGNLAPRPSGGGTLLDFTPSGARVAIVPIPGPVLRYLADRLNPVLDLSGFPIPLRVSGVEARAGRLHIRGSVDPEEVMRRTAGHGRSGASAD